MRIKSSVTAGRKGCVTTVFWNRRSIGRKPATMPISSKKRPRFGKAWRRTILLSTATFEPLTATGEQLSPPYTFLAINGTQLTANAEEAYTFVSGLYEKGEFTFDKLVPWLRSNVKTGSSAL